MRRRGRPRGSSTRSGGGGPSEAATTRSPSLGPPTGRSWTGSAPPAEPGVALSRPSAILDGMDEHLAANRALWDEWAEINARSASYDLEDFKRGGVRIRDYEIEEVGQVKGKTLLHLQCHFGIDSLSWARLGAKVTGVDFSERAIQLATAVAAELGLDVSFIRSEERRVGKECRSRWSPYH